MHRFIMSFLFILLSDSCSCANRRVQQVGKDGKPMGIPTANSRVNPWKPPLTHISEFTDPDTGLNPFLDIEEGRVNDAGRNFADEDEEEKDLVADLPFPDLQPLEDDTSHTRGRHEDDNFDTRGRQEDDSFDTRGRQEDDSFDTRGQLPDESTWLWHAEEGAIFNNVSPSDDIVQMTTTIADEVTISFQTGGQRISEQDTMEWSDSRYVTMCLSVSFCSTLLVVVVVGACWWTIRSRRTVRTTDLEGESKLPTK